MRDRGTNRYFRKRELGDFVALGGQVGVVGHVKIGAGAQIAGSSNVRGDVPPGARWGGTPAKPTRLWFREMTLLRRLAERKDLKLRKRTKASDRLGFDWSELR